MSASPSTELVVPIQTTLDTGVDLADVTFCVVDLETTGGSPRDARITEVGAVKYRGGERIGSFQALVDPEIAIPPFIAHLTGITDQLVAGMPPIEEILPSFIEFARGTVFVAHNASFDFGFVNAGLERLDYPPLAGPPICTARLARRVVWPEVPNVKLLTLSKYFRTRVKPIHRALDDAEACAEVLHGLLDLGGRLGIETLGDLREAVRARGRPHFGKIQLADALPHAPGVYVFRSRDGRVLYVGKSNDLRTRVKSYFYGDERKRIDDLLAEVASIDSHRCASEPEALALEARLIQADEPPYNRHQKAWRRGAYVKLDPREAFPRLKIVRAVRRDDGCVYLGPFGNATGARLAKEALEEVFPLRRCTRSMGASTRFAACALADIGRCPAPCVGAIDPTGYATLAQEVAASLDAPASAIAALEARMSDLADQERFEEAALVRDRLRALADGLRRRRHDAWLVGPESLVFRLDDGAELAFHHGSLTRAGDGCARRSNPLSIPCPRERAGELAAVRGWLARHPTAILRLRGPAPAEPVDGGAAIARILRISEDADLPPPQPRGRRSARGGR